MFASSHSVLILYKMHCIGELFFTLCFARFVKQPEDRSPVWSRTGKRGEIVNSLQVGTQFPKQVGLPALPIFRRWLGSITCIYSFLWRSIKEELAWFTCLDLKKASFLDYANSFAEPLYVVVSSELGEADWHSVAEVLDIYVESGVPFVKMSGLELNFCSGPTLHMISLVMVLLYMHFNY